MTPHRRRGKSGARRPEAGLRDSQKRDRTPPPKELKVLLYENDAGRQPIERFLVTLSRKPAARLAARVKELKRRWRERVPIWDGQQFKKAKHNAEFDGTIRFRVGKIRYRVFMGIDRDVPAAVLLDGQEKDQAEWDLRTANARWRNYLRRKRQS